MSILDDDKLLIRPDAETLIQTAQTLNIGVAIVDLDGWAVLFENAKFFKWFPPGSDADESLVTRLPGLKADRALKRFQKGRAYSFETEAEAGGRSFPLSIEVRPLPDQDSAEASDQVVVECHDITKQKQAEYMLESYSKMAEKNSRDLQREKDRVERLLLNVMPKSVYEETKRLAYQSLHRAGDSADRNGIAC